MENQTVTRPVLVVVSAKQKYVRIQWGLEPAIPVLELWRSYACHVDHVIVNVRSALMFWTLKLSVQFRFTGAVLGDPEYGRCCDFSGWREGPGTASSTAYFVLLMSWDLVILRFFSPVFQIPGEGQFSCVSSPTGAHGRELLDITIRQTVPSIHSTVL
jgi:hypothetical protein